MWSVYLDDFLCLSCSSKAKHIDFCVSSLFSLLGWKVSKNKLLDFNTVCKVLEVQLDLKHSGEGLCFVTNTGERVDELVSDISEALACRRFRRLLRVLSNHVSAGRRTLSSTTRDCLGEIKELLTVNAPRKVEATQAEVVHVYVDASFHQLKYSGLGGMLVDMPGNTLFFFSEKVDDETLDSIMTKGQHSHPRVGNDGRPSC